MARSPQTLAHVRVIRQSWEDGYLSGEIEAGSFRWSFSWNFRQGELDVEPSLGRALIRDALQKFLVQKDYQLEPGGDYSFIVRARL